MTPSVTVAMPALTASPNPSVDGSYTVSWTPITGASKYRLQEDGAPSYEGPGHSSTYTDKAAGTYTYSLTYCVTAFGIEACNFRPAVAEVAVTVSDR